MRMGLKLLFKKLINTRILGKASNPDIQVVFISDRVLKVAKWKCLTIYSIICQIYILVKKEFGIAFQETRKYPLCKLLPRCATTNNCLGSLRDYGFKTDCIQLGALQSS